MIVNHPSVQFNTKHIHVCYSASSKRNDKRIANRRHRRVLNQITRRFVNDIESFYSEDFAAPSFSNWDID